MVLSKKYPLISALMWVKQCLKPSPSHHHFYRRYVYHSQSYHSQSWLVYGIVLPTWPNFKCWLIFRLIKMIFQHDLPKISVDTWSLYPLYKIINLNTDSPIVFFYPKSMSQIGSSSQVLGNIKNVPNHQPVVLSKNSSHRNSGLPHRKSAFWKPGRSIDATHMAHQRLDGGEGFQAPHSDGAILRTCSGCMGQAWDIPTETQGFLWFFFGPQDGVLICFNMF